MSSSLLDQPQGLGLHLGIGLSVMPGGIAQLQARLGQQGVEGRVQGVADIEVLAFLAQVHWPQAHREQRPTQGLENVCHGLARRQFAPALFITDPPVVTMVCSCQWLERSLTIKSPTWRPDSRAT